MNFIQSIFWDSKSNGFSASRFVMIGGFFVTSALSIIAGYIVLDSYRHGTLKDLPDFSWLVYGGGASGGIGFGAYAMNRLGTMRDSVYPNDEDDGGVVQPSEDER